MPSDGALARVEPRLRCWKLNAPACTGGRSTFRNRQIVANIWQYMKRSVELFVEETNKRGGINGRKIESIIYDAASELTKAVLAAKRLIEQDQVEVIVGDGNRSDIGLALIPTVQRAEVPLMSVSGATGLVEPVRDRAWVFKSTVNDTEVVARLLEFFKNNLCLFNLYSLSVPTTDFLDLLF